MTQEDEEHLLQHESDSDAESDFEDEKDVVRRSRWADIRIALLGSAVLVVILAGLLIWKPWNASSTVSAPQELTTATLTSSTAKATSTTTHHEDAAQPDGNDKKPVFSPENYMLQKNWDTKESPQRREFHWTVADAEFNPDGVYRPMMVINNQFPGPLIRANEDDTIVVHVKNEATNATSFHWHGLYQNGTPWMDGSVGISQCPIAPGASFTYEFQVRGQSGTYWYHAHQGAQASDGLVGPMVIHPRVQEYPEMLSYDTDQIVMVSDHYHDLTSELMMEYLASDAENAEPVPNGALINGRGSKDCSKYPTRKCDATSPHVGHPRLELAAGKNHKLRFINVGAFAEFQIAIDEHNFAVVEVDGTEVIPKYYDRFTINSAQRYSVVVSANQTAGDSYWLRAKMMTTCFTDPPKDLDAEIWAVIATNPDNKAVPESKELDASVESICKDMDTTQLEPAKNIQAPEEADATFHLRANFEIGAWQLSRGFFNSSSWRPDIRNPTLHRVIDGLHEKNNTFVARSSETSVFVNDIAFDMKRELVIQSSGVQVIDMIVTNFDDGNHPLHLHGYKFFVLGQGHGYYDPTTHKADTRNPLRRDTASVEAYGWLWIRIIANNPGVWPFHCHITWHTEAGLLMQLATRTDELEKMTIPDKNRQLCSAPISELRKGGTPEDQVFYGQEG